MKIFPYLIVILVIVCTACSSESVDGLNKALKEAGQNRSEFESVIAHYGNEPQKEAAAEFLISNMMDKYSVQGNFLDHYYALQDSLQSLEHIGHEDMRVFYDSIYQSHKWKQLRRVPDLEHVSGEYLIRHIDAAFEVWKSPWAKHLSFDEFCEYLLPYRVGNESLEPWMHDYHRKYSPWIDTLQTDCIDSIYAAISRKIEGHRYFTPDFVPDCRPSSLHGIRIGACRMYSALSIYLFRSLGIPIVCEFTPNWSNHAMGHEWTSIYVGGKSYPIQLGEKAMLGRHVKEFVFRAPKIYRTLYSSRYGLINDEEDVPSLFKDKRTVDVTAEYLPTATVDLQQAFPKRNRQKYAYLCVFDLMNWKPVAYGKRKNKGYRFENMGLNAVYLPVYYEKGVYSSAYYPLKVDDKGEVTVLKPDTTSLRKVVLRRKFMDDNPMLWADAMNGGYFVFGKDLDFRDSDTLMVTPLSEYAFQERTLNGTYRCMKYVPPIHTKGNIAEIELYDAEGNRVEGKVMGNYAPGWLDSMLTMSRAFDGDVLSFTSASPEQTDAWLGLDFGRMVDLNRLVYLPRTDDNFIREGELYELFYWDNGWVSLGQRTGSRKLQYLEYDNVPDNALLLLRNLTKGKEERIFTYEHGKQVWW